MLSNYPPDLLNCVKRESSLCNKKRRGLLLVFNSIEIQASPNAYEKMN